MTSLNQGVGDNSSASCVVLTSAANTSALCWAEIHHRLGVLGFAIAPGIVAAEIERAHGKNVAELGQWERVMRAHWHVRRLTGEDCLEAIRLIEEVLQRDPKNALALADLAYNWHMGGLFGWTKEPLPEAMERMGDAARRAVAADGQDASAHTSLALYELFSNRHDDAIRRLHRAIALDPNSSFARGNLGVAYSFGGEPDRSLAALEEAKRLSPRDFLMVIWHTASAWSHLHAERFAEAVNCAKQAIEFNPAFPDAYCTLAASAAHLGDMVEARAALDVFVRLLPGLTLGDPRLIRPFRRPVDRERFLTGLRKAGLSEWFHAEPKAPSYEKAEITLAAVASARSWEHPLASCPTQPGASCRRQLERKTNRSCRDIPPLCLSHRAALNFPHTRDYRTSGKNVAC